MYKGKKIGVVVPAYNEEKLIADTIKSIPDYVDHAYIINDASTDNTAKIAYEFVDGRVHLISHGCNSGVGAAIVTGYKAAIKDNIDIIAVMAGDNQMDPLNLPKLLDPVVEDKADYAVGDRLSNSRNQKGMSPWRRLGNFLLKWLTRIAAWNFSINDPQNGYTAVSYKALSKLDLDKIYPRYGYCNDVLIKFSGTGARITQIPMPAVYGKEKSKIRYRKYIPSVSLLLLRGFLWRITKVFKKG